MKVGLIKTSGNSYYDEDDINKLMEELISLKPSKEEYVDSWKDKHWYLFVEINTINDIEFIQKYFDEELVIDLRGEEPFIEVYDDYREV